MKGLLNRNLRFRPNSPYTASARAPRCKARRRAVERAVCARWLSPGRCRRSGVGRSRAEEGEQASESRRRRGLFEPAPLSVSMTGIGDRSNEEYGAALLLGDRK
jgi:hypothetical protein